MQKKFISIIWGYHKQIFAFDKKQNYHMLPIEVMKEEGFDCEIFSIDSQVRIEDDPNFIEGVKVVYYKGFLDYLNYLYKNRNAIIYSNSLTLKTLLVGSIGKKTVFCPHSYPFGHNLFKRIIILFFYQFFKKIRINNSDEYAQVENIKKGLGYVCPLSLSDSFLNRTNQDRKNAVWIGNLTPIKNPEFLIELGKIIKNSNCDFKIYIIGEDRYNLNGQNFAQLIVNNNLQDILILKGVLSHIDIKKILSESLIYINTSISEGQCLAVYEGALSGNILCLPNIIAFPSVFGEKALYHKNPHELYMNIQNILNKHGKWGHLIQSNQKMILEKYNYDYIKKELKNMFLSI